MPGWWTSDPCRWVTLEVATDPSTRGSQIVLDYLASKHASQWGHLSSYSYRFSLLCLLFLFFSPLPPISCSPPPLIFPHFLLLPPLLLPSSLSDSYTSPPLLPSPSCFSIYCDFYYTSSSFFSCSSLSHSITTTNTITNYFTTAESFSFSQTVPFHLSSFPSFSIFLLLSPPLLPSLPLWCILLFLCSSLVTYLLLALFHLRNRTPTSVVSPYLRKMTQIHLVICQNDHQRPMCRRH